MIGRMTPPSLIEVVEQGGDLLPLVVRLLTLADEAYQPEFDGYWHVEGDVFKTLYRTNSTLPAPFDIDGGEAYVCQFLALLAATVRVVSAKDATGSVARKVEKLAQHFRVIESGGDVRCAPLRLQSKALLNALKVVRDSTVDCLGVDFPLLHAVNLKSMLNGYFGEYGGDNTSYYQYNVTEGYKKYLSDSVLDDDLKLMAYPFYLKNRGAVGCPLGVFSVLFLLNVLSELLLWRARL